MESAMNMEGLSMYKITKGDKCEFADKYTAAERIYNRFAKSKYPCAAFTRLYCDLGDGYKLMRVTSKSIGRA